MDICIGAIRAAARWKRKGNYILGVLIAFLVVVFLMVGAAAHAEENTTKVVRVGFPIQEGTSYIDENGNYAGYLVDYLAQLSLFIDWDLEFVQVEGDLDTQLETLMAMLRTGEIDMLGTMNRDTYLEELFLYPNYSYGTRYTALAVLQDDPQWIEEDFASWDGIRVATFPGYEEQMSEFIYYTSVNDFTYEIVNCGSYEEMIQAVRDGRADAMIQSDISMTEGFRMIGRFSPSPYYFALSPDNTELLQQLNIAMRSLNSAQPDLQTESSDCHSTFMDGFQISEEHRAYIQSLGTLKVLFFDGDAPYQYVKDGELTGFAVEYFRRFAQDTGLQYETVIADSYQEALAILERGEVDLVACIPTNSTMNFLENVEFTMPYFNSFSVTACTNSDSNHCQGNLSFWLNTVSALDQLQSGELNGVRADYYSLSYYLRKGEVYNKVTVDWANAKNLSYTVGVTSNVPQEFVTILNQYASSMSSDAKHAIMYRYSGDPVTYTFSEWLWVNRTALIFSSIVAICLGVILCLHIHSRRNAYKALLAENRLVHLTMYDEKTGAYNESQFRKILEERCRNQENIALVALNIRSFKYINNTYGTERADEMLCEITRILEERIGKDEFFCRPSADLFYLALHEETTDSLVARTEDIVSAIVSIVALELDGHPLSLYSGAVFVGESPAPYCVSPNISYMMVALAHAKQENCSTVYIFDKPLYQAEQMRYYIETHMQAALEQEEYQLYLQPKMNLQTDNVDSAEALVRWQSKERGMIYPNQFIPLFEENGFCVRLDLYMVEQVCKTLRKWMDSGLTPIVISVNQTKSLFVEEDYVDRLLTITEKYHISPQYITLEILEGLAFENLQTLNSTIQRLNDAGFRVSMDDFGSGYSSLNTLGKLEINELKLDRTFLMDVVNDPDGSQSEVLESVLILAKKLGIKTVAEGVETKESEDVIRSMSCDYGQGYYYSKPIPAEDFRQKFCSSRK